MSKFGVELWSAIEQYETALNRITGLYLHESVTQDDAITVRQMYETALAALGRTPKTA